MTAEIVVLSPIEGERKRPIEGERKRLLFLVANALILWMIHGTIVSRCCCGALLLWGETSSAWQAESAWQADAELGKNTVLQLCFSNPSSPLRNQLFKKLSRPDSQAEPSREFTRCSDGPPDGPLQSGRNRLESVLDEWQVDVRCSSRSETRRLRRPRPASLESFLRRHVRQAR